MLCEFCDCVRSALFKACWHTHQMCHISNGHLLQCKHPEVRVVCLEDSSRMGCKFAKLRLWLCNQPPSICLDLVAGCEHLYVAQSAALTLHYIVWQQMRISVLHHMFGDVSLLGNQSTPDCLCQAALASS